MDKAHIAFAAHFGDDARMVDFVFAPAGGKKDDVAGLQVFEPNLFPCPGLVFGLPRQPDFYAAKGMVKQCRAVYTGPIHPPKAVRNPGVAACRLNHDIGLAEANVTQACTAVKKKNDP